MNVQDQPLKLMIADDHELFRKGFRTALQHEDTVQIIADACNGKEVLDLVQQYEPDIIFMDIKMPILNGIETTKIITEKYPACAVVGLSSCDEHYMVEDMLAAGALGYLLKDAGRTQIMEAIHAAMEKQKYICNATRRMMDMQHVAFPSKPGLPKKQSLTPRQTEILKLICEQRTKEEIAEMLNLSIRTIEGFRRKLFAKTNAQNEAGLAIYAINNGIYRQ